MKQHLDMYTYKVETQQKTMTCNFFISPFITARKIAYIYACFSSISSRILFSFWYYHYLTETTKFDNMMDLYFL